MRRCFCTSSLPPVLSGDNRTRTSFPSLPHRQCMPPSPPPPLPLLQVFGEVYPDPVRVVSVGASVDDLLREPEAPGWAGYSIEFCGGTHIANTSRAGAFALIEEGSIAKGVRRIVGVTREPATAATDRAAQLQGEFATARALSGAALETKINDLKTQLNDAVIPAATKARLRDELGELGKKLVAEQKAEGARLVEAGKTVAVAAVTAAKSAGKKAVVVADLPINADGKAAQGIMKAISDAFPEVAFLGVSSDGKEKVLVFAVAPKEAVAAGAGAVAWINAALAAAGGKGGGRDDGAQGSAKDVTKVGAIVEAAQGFIAGKY